VNVTSKRTSQLVKVGEIKVESEIAADDGAVAARFSDEQPIMESGPEVLSQTSLKNKESRFLLTFCAGMPILLFRKVFYSFDGEFE
jgi:hypothetical protein